MSCFNEKTVPVISTLAKEFAIFDKWFSSVPGIFLMKSFMIKYFKDQQM